MTEAMADADEQPRPSRRSSVAQRSGSDEIQERYLRRAISEINELGDVFLLKYRPTQSEIAEGVAFFGRAGQALLKSLQRLSVDPLAIYGTNCLKFGTEEPEDARRWLTRELHIVQPKLVVAMGSETVAFLDDLDFPLSDAVDVARPGEIQPFTPTIDALVTPDIDASLDEQDAKTRFWNAFKALGAWWSELPPY